MRLHVLPQALILGTLLAAIGCHVQVDKGKNGEDKNVRIDTPLGGLHVRSDQTTALDLGLPVYPGAQISPDHEGDKSADVHFGFGQFQLRIRVVTYQTNDDRDKVVAFYKGAMGRFGDVLSCQGNHPVGSPTITAEGLTCSEDSKVQVRSGAFDDDSSFSLRAGSKHHQHIFAIKNGGPGTRFSLVEIQLPTGLEEGSSKTSD
ncbi:MAG TPA: hypothetical protein VL990_03570 [Acidobacteriaceae bacterium]|nr:hypothetical protein [Acidobacteriaceae bacterium]